MSVYLKTRYINTIIVMVNYSKIFHKKIKKLLSEIHLTNKKQEKSVTLLTSTEARIPFTKKVSIKKFDFHQSVCMVAIYFSGLI